jgi:hypothetical protein
MFRDNTAFSAYKTAAFHPTIRDLLNNVDTTWHHDWNTDQFLHECQLHGVAALVAANLLENSCEDSNLPPQDLVHELRQILASHRMYEKLHQGELVELLALLQVHGIETILLKGTAFAYSIYPDPHLRSRGDTDLIIEDNNRTTVNETLLTLGYQVESDSNARFNSYQQLYSKQDKFGFSHSLDVHWRINNHQLFASIFSWEELAGNTTDLVSLSEHAKTLRPEYQFVHACLHRVIHLYSPYHFKQSEVCGDRIIWLQDIYLLTKTMQQDEWSRTANLCVDKKVCNLILDTISAVTTFFPIDVPIDVMDKLNQHASAEDSSILLSSSSIRRQVYEFSMLAWPARLVLLKEITLPPSKYILEKYKKKSLLWLPFLYVYRIARAIVRAIVK